MIELEVDTQEGWQEEVRFTTASWGSERFKMFTDRKTWVDAEAHCQSAGGHLASVLTKEEQKEVVALIYGDYAKFWLGGSYHGLLVRPGTILIKRRGMDKPETILTVLGLLTLGRMILVKNKSLHLQGWLFHDQGEHKSQAVLH